MIGNLGHNLQQQHFTQTTIAWAQTWNLQRRVRHMAKAPKITQKIAQQYGSWEPQTIDSHQI
jgi:hypothetical protein